MMVMFGRAYNPQFETPEPPKEEGLYVGRDMYVRQLEAQLKWLAGYLDCLDDNFQSKDGVERAGLDNFRVRVDSLLKKQVIGDK